MGNNTILNHRLGIKFQLYRIFWNFTWKFVCFFLPRTLFNGIKISILRLFGSETSKKAVVYSGVNIYNPKNLIMEDNAVLGPDVDCYCVDKVILKKGAIVSQKTYLCTASHNIYDGTFKLITAPIIIKENAWIAADAFIGMGVCIGENSVVAARSCVIKDVADSSIVGGNPAKFIKNRF